MSGPATPPAVTLEDVRRAAAVIAGQVTQTPCLAAPRLSELTGATVFVKYENMQPTGSFKERGALTKLMSLSDEERRRGVVAMSAGNHAQAVAYHARRLAIPATIVMPEPTPLVKAENTRAHGARVLLHGETLYEAAERAAELVREEGFVLVHPYDDPLIIAGQGTIGLEMLAAVPDLDDLVVPIGGGGLISGIATAAKGLRPDIRLIGVEAALYPSFCNAISGEDAPIGGPTLAEGIAVKTVGRGDPADRASPRLTDRQGRRGAARMCGRDLCDAVAHDGGGCGSGGSCRHAGATRSVCRTPRRPRAVRRQHRREAPRLRHGP